MVLDEDGEMVEKYVGNICVSFGVMLEEIENPAQYFLYNVNHCIMPSQIDTMIPATEFDKKKGEQNDKVSPY